MILRRMSGAIDNLQIQMIQAHDNNYLTEENGCFVSKCSSENPKGKALNLLNSINRLIWFTSDPLPHEIVISLQDIVHKPQSYNCIGFYCWHQYDTNPALVELFVKGGDSNQAWKLVSKIRLEMNDGWQDFKIAEIHASAVKELKIRVVQNFGGDKVYLNQVALRYNKPTVGVSRKSRTIEEYDNILIPKEEVPKGKREKTFSEFTKLTSTEKELKKANEKIRQLSEEQQAMKDRMEKQDRIVEKHERTIFKLQDSIKTMLTTIQKLHQMQEVKEARHEEYGRGYKSGKTSTNKKAQKKNASVKKDAQFIRMDSENEFSEYSNFQTIQSTQKNCSGGDKKQLLEQLSKLLTLRDKKKSMLESQQNSQVNRGYEEYEDSDYE